MTQALPLCSRAKACFVQILPLPYAPLCSLVLACCSLMLSSCSLMLPYAPYPLLESLAARSCCPLTTSYFLAIRSDRCVFTAGIGCLIKSFCIWALPYTYYAILSSSLFPLVLVPFILTYLRQLVNNSNNNTSVRVLIVLSTL